MDGDEDKARDLYREGITIAARGGFIHDAALANERFFDFVRERDIEEARYRIKEAVRFYSNWGAMARVQKLQNEFPDFFESSAMPADVGGSHHSE